MGTAAPGGMRPLEAEVTALLASATELAPAVQLALTGVLKALLAEQELSANERSAVQSVLALLWPSPGAGRRAA